MNMLDIIFLTEILLERGSNINGSLSDNRQGGFWNVTPAFSIALSIVLDTSSEVKPEHNSQWIIYLL